MPEQTTRAPNENFPILFVDDDPTSHKIVQAQLVDWNIVYAFSAEEALDILSRENILIVITDIAMPGMNGIELLRRIKRTNGAIQVIIITATLDMDNLIHALEAGANDFLLKPLRRENLLQAIVNTLQKTRRWKKVMSELFEKRRQEQKS
ncbi:MAG: response regulator [Candidatus Cloacimonetes bacterium]|nr:response regulator [Candidatus Cloacimonadota bacterium]